MAKRAQEEAEVEINKLKAQIREVLIEVERQKSLATTESTKRLNTDKRLTNWEKELKAKVTKVKEKIIEEYKALSEFHNRKVVFMGNAYIVGKDFVQKQIVVQHLEQDLSFLDGGDDKDEDWMEDALDAPVDDALVASLANNNLAPPAIDAPHLKRDPVFFFHL